MSDNYHLNTNYIINQTPGGKVKCVQQFAIFITLYPPITDFDFYPIPPTSTLSWSHEATLNIGLRKQSVSVRMFKDFTFI